MSPHRRCRASSGTSRRAATRSLAAQHGYRGSCGKARRFENWDRHERRGRRLLRCHPRQRDHWLALTPSASAAAHERDIRAQFPPEPSFARRTATTTRCGRRRAPPLFALRLRPINKHDNGHRTVVEALARRLCDDCAVLVETWSDRQGADAVKMSKCVPKIAGGAYLTDRCAPPVCPVSAHPGQR